MCDSAQGREVRDGVLNDDLGFNLARVLLPFPVLAGLIGLLYRALLAIPADPEENPRGDA